MYNLLPYHKKEQKLSEIMQSLDLKMSFAVTDRIDGDDVQRIHDWVKCRDFLGDVIYATHSKKKQYIYGFAYDPKVDLPIDKQNLTLLLKFPSKKMQDIFLSNISILDKLCVKNNVALVNITHTSEKLIIVLTADKFWQQNIPLLSFFTFLLKVMCVEYTDPLNWKKELPEKYTHSPETKYINDCGKYLDILFNNCYNIYKTDKNITGILNLNIFSIHNNSGFVSICNTILTYPQNSHRERLLNYVKKLEGSGKTMARGTRKPKEVAETIHPAA